MLVYTEKSSQGGQPSNVNASGHNGRQGEALHPSAFVFPHVTPCVGRAYSINEKEEDPSERSDHWLLLEF